MNYQHRFRVQAPLEAVAEFHSHPAAMAAITPPPIFVQVHQAPPAVADGQAMDFTMWLGPLPLRWQASFEDVTATGFVDRMVQGPLAAWSHRHSFVPVGDAQTDVVDELAVQVRRHPVWGPIGLGMSLNLSPVADAASAGAAEPDRRGHDGAAATCRQEPGPDDAGPGRSRPGGRRCSQHCRAGQASQVAQGEACAVRESTCAVRESKRCRHSRAL